MNERRENKWIVGKFEEPKLWDEWDENIAKVKVINKMSNDAINVVSENHECHFSMMES